ncbi:MAG TPA: hypothetical protein VIJ75_17490 [Hanamia sp.]
MDQQTLDFQIPIKKIYKEKEIYIGTFLGGPIVAGYLIAENFKNFNEPEKAKKTWMYTIIATVVIFGGIFLIPGTAKIPNQIIPLVYTGIAYLLVQRFQNKQITSHLDSGGQIYSWWRTIAVGLIGLAITLIAVFGLLYFSNAQSNNQSTATFGIKKHEIVYNKNNMAESEIDNLGNAFTQTNFFDLSVQKFVYAKKDNNTYELTISCNNSVANNKEVQAPFIQLRKDMQIYFPQNKIIINLAVDDLDNVVKRIE